MIMKHGDVRIVALWQKCLMQGQYFRIPKDAAHDTSAKWIYRLKARLDYCVTDENTTKPYPRHPTRRRGSSRLEFLPVIQLDSHFAMHHPTDSKGLWRILDWHSCAAYVDDRNLTDAPGYESKAYSQYEGLHYRGSGCSKLWVIVVEHLSH